jgi:hypothetical protein
MNLQRTVNSVLTVCLSSGDHPTVSRTVTSQAPSDDEALSLIERFLDLNSTAIPSMIVKAINPHEDEYYRV